MTCSRRYSTSKSALVTTLFCLGLMSICLMTALSGWIMDEFTGKQRYEIQNRNGTDVDLHLSQTGLRASSPTVSAVFLAGQRLHKRANFTHDLCRTNWSTILKPPPRFSRVFYDDKKKLLQCWVAKAGCTYWGRIFSFLTRPNMMRSLRINNPANIDRYWLHDKSGVQGKRVVLSKLESRFQNSTGLRFFFSREPYERLWSSYLDKYFLPSYWNATWFIKTPDKCKTNITFNDFLKRAVNSIDVHVIPVSQMCNPCVFKPDVIGDMDTFTSDTEYILGHANLSHFLKHYGERSYAEREVTSLTRYQFTQARGYSECLTSKELARRLWKVFQYNGYIRESSEFPENRPDYSSSYSIQMFLDEAMAMPVMTRVESKRQKRRFLVQAYRDIPESVIQRIQTRYKGDFVFFRYDPNPPS